MPEKARAQAGGRGATAEVERLILAFPVLPVTGPVALEAPRGVREHLLSYYNA